MTEDYKEKIEVFIISDGTGITAETTALCLMNSFNVDYQFKRYLFIDTLDKAHQIVAIINKIITKQFSQKFLAIATISDPAIKNFLNEHCKCKVINPVEPLINTVADYLKLQPQQITGRFTKIVNTSSYHDRMEAINYTINHDDGHIINNFSLADIIIIGVSRSAKTPTSIYLALQYGLKVANYPLTPDDFERKSLHNELLKYKEKVFGLSIDPRRLSQIRNERFPNSNYASYENCKYEVTQAEQLMNAYAIEWISSTKKSIEEISALIIQKIIK